MSSNIEKIRASYSRVGPTSDNSSKISLMKKIQVRVGGNKAQLWGLNNKEGNVSGSNGDAGTRTKFSSIFPRFSF
tara:strand:+ start:13938 stop:14162 length:225 start_codon:yes stop_codon:yes gene_type:complete